MIRDIGREIFGILHNDNGMDLSRQRNAAHHKWNLSIQEYIFFLLTILIPAINSNDQNNQILIG